jgi:hypothetical protein
MCRNDAERVQTVWRSSSLECPPDRSPATTSSAATTVGSHPSWHPCPDLDRRRCRSPRQGGPRSGSRSPTLPKRQHQTGDSCSTSSTSSRGSADSEPCTVRFAPPPAALHLSAGHKTAQCQVQYASWRYPGLNTATALISTDSLTCGNAAPRERAVASLEIPDVQV